MGTIQVPGRISGRTYTIDIKGDTPSETEQARIRAFLDERENAFAAQYEARYGAPLAVDDGTAIGRGWEVGKAGAYSRLGTATEYLGRGLGLESLVGTGQRMRQEGDYEGFLDSLRQPAPTTLEDVKAAEGILPTAGAALTYVGEGIGQSGPEMLAPLAASGIGTLVGGPVAGLGAGAATAFPSFFGGNVQRQEAEVAAGRKEEVDVTNAIVGAIGQSALNSIGDKLLLGGFLKPGQKWLTRTAVGAAEGAAAEIPTEIAQQIIERKQAGLQLDNDEAINEYINAGILGGVIGGGIRGTTAGLGIGVNRPAAPSATPPAPDTLGLPKPTKPGVATVMAVRRQGPRFGPATTTTVFLNDGAELTLEGDAAEADIARAVDQHNQTKAAAEAPAAPKAPTVSVEDIPEAEIISDEGRPTGGVSIDEDLAEARAVYDERLAIAEEGGAEPEDAKRIAARAAVDYVDSLQADAQQRLARFRSTMARIATASTRGDMPPDLPDSAYAQEFATPAQQTLFEAPPAAPAPQPEYRQAAEAQAAQAEVPTPTYRQAAEAQAAETRPAAPKAEPPTTPKVTEIGPEGMTLVHGGRSGLNLDDVEIVRSPAEQKQGKKGRSYGGFYAASEADAEYAQSYADRIEDGTTYNVRIKPGTRVLPKEGDITRLSEAQITDWKAQGIGVVVGKDPRGKTEYAVIDKGAIETLAPRTRTAPSSEPSSRAGIDEVRRDQYEKGNTAIEYRLGTDGTATALTAPDNTAHLMNIQIGDADSAARGKGRGTQAYAEIGQRLAAEGIRLQSTQWSKHNTAISPAALRVWEKLAANGQARQIGTERGKVVDRFTGKEEVRDVPIYEFVSTPAPEVQDVPKIETSQPEAVGTGIPSNQPSVGRGGERASGVQAPERIEAPAGGGLGRNLPLSVGTPAAERVQPDTLSQLEEQLAAARTRAAELRKQVPAGILERELVGGKIDPRLPKQISNLQNVLARQQKAADAAREAVPQKPTHPARPKKLAQYEAALAKVNETQAQLASVQDQLSTAELAAGLQRAAVPKAPMNEKAQSAYTAYFNALQDADTLRQTLESERARNAVAPEQRPALPSLRSDILPELNVVYPAGGTRGLGQAVPSLRDPVIAEAPLTMLGQRKVLPPASVTWKVAEDVRKANIRERFSKFFAENASPALVRHTTARGGFNNEATWKNFPDWMSAGDQLRVLQLLGRPTREQRTKYKISEEESPRLTDEESAARTYFAKMLRPVDAIDMMLADLSVYYDSYKSAPGQTDAGLQALLLGTGSDPAKLALNWVRANLSPETNAEIDLILKKQAEKDAVTADWIGAEGTDRVAGGRTARDAARKARKAAAEESGYDAMSIVHKMVAGDSRVALDQEMHYSVKAALNAGDLRGALQALADTTSNLELKDMASRFAGLVGTTRVRVLYPGDSAKYIGNDRGTYVQQRRADLDPDYQNIILINGQTGMTNHVLMHEMAHALSSRFIDENPNHPVVKQLQDLLSALREVGPKQQLFSTGRGTARVAYPTDFYGLTDISEMVAEGYGRLAFGETDNGLRDLMKRTRLRDPVDRQVEFENPLNAWDRFKELAGNILNVIMRKPLTRRPRTKRIETAQVYETAADRFHRLVDGLLSEAPQVLPESVLQAAVTKPMVAINVLNNAVNNAPVWSPEGMSRLAQLMTTAIPQPLRRALLGLLQLDWFNDFAGKYFPQIAQLKEIDDLRRGKYQAFNKGVQGVLQDLLAFAQKSPELYSALMSIQGQATLAGVDPTRPVSDYAGDKEKTDEWYNLNRQLTSPEMRKLFKQTRNVFQQFRDEIKRVLKSRALDITNDEAKANNLVAQLLKKLDEENAIDPYFALMRTGEHWLVYTAEDTTAAPVAVGPLGQMKRPTTQYVQAFTDPFARDRFRAKLEAARDADGNPIAWNIESQRVPMGDFSRGSAPSVAFAQGALNIISSFGGAGASTAEQQKVQEATNAIQELFVRLTPDHSAMKAFIKRKGTRGFMGDITPLGVVETPTDFISALARKADGLAYQLINIEYGGKIQKLIDSSLETRNELMKNGSLTEPEQAALDAYYNEFVERAQLAKAPRVGAFGQFIRGITFGWTLGFNVAGAINNLVQLPMIGMTELAGRYGGLGNAKRELGFAMRVLKNAGKNERVVSFGPDGREIRELSGVDNYGSLGNYFEPVITVDPKTGQEVITSRLRTDMKIPEALRNKLANMDVLAEVMANHGMLNASMSQELLEAEAGWLHKINRWSGFLQHHAERFNRQSMAIAAYNLELGKLDGPATPAAKLAAAMKAIEITERVNGTIGAATAPRYAMGSFGSVVFMFKRFALHMTRYIVNTANQALRGASKEDRAVARYQITGMLGTTALFAGVQGLPFFSELMTLINLLFTDDDEERPEVLVQKFLGEPYYHGALNYLLGIDIASRISMSGLIFRENKIEKDQSIMYDAIEMFGGPAVGVFQNLERGVNLINDGEFYRGVEAMSPAAIKSILKSFRFSTDGATTLRGDEVVPVTYADIIKQVLGYTPVDLARTQERVSGAKRLDEAIRNRKRKLLRRYNVAVVDGDFVEVRDVLQEMREFSRQYPEEEITDDTVNRSHRSFLQRSTEMISGVSFTNRERGQAYVDEFDEDTTVWGSQ